MKRRVGSNRHPRKLVVLCDFDGTIAESDLGVLVLEGYAKGDWQSLDNMLEEGEISLEDCLTRQYSFVKTSKKEILRTLDLAKVGLRANFRELVSYCAEKGFPIVIASAGLDFCIKRFLELNKLWDTETLTVYSPKTRFTRTKGIRFIFPDLKIADSTNFKQDLVLYYQRQGIIVAYIGDGTSDYEPARVADFVFSITSSPLSKMCQGSGIPHFEFTEFSKIVRVLRKNF